MFSFASCRRRFPPFGGGFFGTSGFEKAALIFK
jgi:hypothetical protein